MRTYLLYIDETGTSSPKNIRQNPYILTGIVVEETNQDKINANLDNLKIKYWGHTNVSLHSEDIGKNLKDFTIFRSKQGLKEQFIDDLVSCLGNCPFMTFHALVDKKKIAPTWTETTVIRKTAQSLFFNFLSYQLTRPPRSRGKIIIEASSTYKDSEYLKAFTSFISPGCPMIDGDFPDFHEIRTKLTQISFVTKLNNDIETQIADIMSYGALCKYKVTNGLTFIRGTYEQKMFDLVTLKQFHLPNAP